MLFKFVWKCIYIVLFYLKSRETQRKRETTIVKLGPGQTQKDSERFQVVTVATPRRAGQWIFSRWREKTQVVKLFFHRENCSTLLMMLIIQLRQEDYEGQLRVLEQHPGCGERTGWYLHRQGRPAGVGRKEHVDTWHWWSRWALWKFCDCFDLLREMEWIDSQGKHSGQELEEACERSMDRAIERGQRAQPSTTCVRKPVSSEVM